MIKLVVLYWSSIYSYSLENSFRFSVAGHYNENRFWCDFIFESYANLIKLNMCNVKEMESTPEQNYVWFDF